jgi:hypothetical protein
LLTVEGDGTFRVSTGNVGVGLQTGSLNGAWYLNDADDSLRWYSSTGGDRLTISSAGNVGIGTNSASRRLEVSDAGVDNFIRVNSNGATKTGIEFASSGAAYGQLYFNNVAPYDLSLLQQYTTGSLILGTNNTERARLTSDGKLLVGTSSTSRVSTAIFQGNSDGASGAGTIRVAVGTASPIDGQNLGFLTFTDSGHSSAVNVIAQRDGGTWTSGSSQPSRLVFSTTADGASSPTERMRIGQDGRTWINTTSQIFAGFGLQVVYSGGVCAFKETSGTAGNNLQVNWHTATSSDNRFIEFGTEASYTIRGSITYNRGGGVTAYNTTSDYRAKTLLGDVENTGQTIDALKVYRGVMNGATIERPMLVAHEAQEVAPYCVTGEKDAVDDDGNPIYQQMDHQVLVPLLIAEIQQLRARVAALEAS